MKLPIKPVYLPMEALVVDEIPRGAEWQYESETCIPIVGAAGQRSLRLS